MNGLLGTFCYCIGRFNSLREISGGLAILTGVVLVGLSLPQLCRAQDPDLPEGNGKDLVYSDCTSCHDVGTILSQRATKEEWSRTVKTMISRGATVPDQEFQIIVDYLTKYLGKVNVNRVNVNKATAKEIESTLEIKSSEAEAIVQYRHDHGDFKDWDSVTKVDGIDFKKLENKKDRLTYSDGDEHDSDKSKRNDQ